MVMGQAYRKGRIMQLTFATLNTLIRPAMAGGERVPCRGYRFVESRLQWTIRSGFSLLEYALPNLIVGQKQTHAMPLTAVKAYSAR
jgi:hypothetical protein